MKIIEKNWQESWWLKLVVAVVAIFLWPFTVGGVLSYFLIKKVKRPLIKWSLVIPIALFTLFFGSAWVSAFVSPKSGHYDYEPITLLNTPSPSAQLSSQTTLTEVQKPTTTPSVTPNPTRTPTPIGKGAAKQVSVCPTKTTNTYKVVKCVVLLDDTNKQYNDLVVVISPLLRSQEDKVRALANTIRANECPKDCYLNIWDDVDSANLAFTYDLLSEADQKIWEQNHASFFATGGGLEKHFIATFDTDGNKFYYMVEPPILSPERKIVKGSTPRGVEFYEKVEALRKQGRVNGELCTEFESDPIVDVNPESPAVQLSLMYPSITGSVKNSDKSLILNDFKVIKALAEQDKSMVLPEYGTLRLFVLTFHDNNCIAKGELQQLMIDNAPEWVDWK